MQLNCPIHGLNHHIVKKGNRTGYMCSKCSYDRVKLNRKNLKKKAIAYKGGECIKCGYNNSKYPEVMEFHHRNPEIKDFAIGKTHGWAKIKNELDKCDMYCANCHREIHADIRNEGC